MKEDDYQKFHNDSVPVGEVSKPMIFGSDGNRQTLNFNELANVSVVRQQDPIRYAPTMRVGNLSRLLIASSLLSSSIAAHSTTGISALAGLQYIYVFAMGLGFVPISIAFLVRRRYGFGSWATQAVLLPAYLILVIGVLTGASFLAEAHLVGAGAWMLAIGAVQVVGIIWLQRARNGQQARNQSLNSTPTEAIQSDAANRRAG